MSMDYKSISDKILAKRNDYLKKKTSIIKNITLAIIPLVLVVGFIFMAGNIDSISQHPLYGGNSATVDGVSIKLIEVNDGDMQARILDFALAKLAQNGAGNYEKANLWKNGYNEDADYLFRVNNSEGSLLLVVITENYILTQSGDLVYISTAEYQQLIKMLF